MREAGSNTILTSLRYLRKRPSKEGTVASGRFGDKPVVCAPSGESDDGDEEFDVPDRPTPAEEQATLLSADPGGGAVHALAALSAEAPPAASTHHAPRTRTATERELAEDGSSERDKRVRRGDIGFVLN